MWRRDRVRHGGHPRQGVLGEPEGRRRHHAVHHGRVGGRRRVMRVEHVAV